MENKKQETIKISNENYIIKDVFAKQETINIEEVLKRTFLVNLKINKIN